MFSQPENAQKYVGARWGSLQRSSDPLAGLRGPTSKGRGEKERGGKGRGGREGRGGKGKGGKGNAPPSEFLKTPLPLTNWFVDDVL